MKLKLVKIKYNDKDKLIEMIQDWNNHNEIIVPTSITRNKVINFDEYINNIDNNDIKDGLVPDITLFCLDEERNIFVGAVNIRLELNNNLMKMGGHIGVGVRPSERSKGIATKMISLALIECKLYGIDKVLMTCDKNNVASSKSIVKNFGQLENEILFDNKTIQRYWINNK